MEALLLRGASVDAVDGAGRTSLHGACERAMPMAVAILLQNGSNADARDLEGYTPLHAAARVGSGRAVELLLRHGADETLVNRDGASAWINVEEATEVAD